MESQKKDLCVLNHLVRTIQLYQEEALANTLFSIYTFTFYLGSAIYTPSAPEIMERFHVSTQVASLGLSMYVLGYGIGPLLFSPLSEVPVVGRNPPYIYTFGLFVILLVPAALAKNVASFMVLRFLTGFFGSPCLATGGGSLADMFSLLKLPYVLSAWAFSATAGPALGPLLSGFSVVVKGWRWSMWELLWLAGPVWVLMFLFLPETSADNILLRRAQRLRRLTGNLMLKSQGEINQAKMTLRDVLIDALWRPIQTVVLDPAIAFTAVYTALIYGIYYSFFEAFPIVYLGYFGFNLGEMGLAFLSIIIGAIIGVSFYLAYCYWIVEPSIRARGLGAPERRLVPALGAAFLLPVGLFIFGRILVLHHTFFEVLTANFYTYSMDREARPPLDRTHHRSYDLHNGNLRRDPMHLLIYTAHLSTVCCIAFCRQRLSSVHIGSRNDSFLEPALHQPRHWPRCKSIGRFDVRLYPRCLRALVFWRMAPSQESVCGKVIVLRFAQLLH